MELFDLEQLVAFAKYKTLSNAALELHLSQPTLTKTMKRLEDEFQVSLFKRSKNKLELNENGKLAASKAQDILTNAKEMVQLVRAIDKERHTISIGSCAPAPAFSLSQSASVAYEDMSISSELKSNDELLKGLENDKYQIIILPYKIDDEKYLTKQYGSESLYFVLPDKHHFAKRKTIALKEMDGENMLLFSDIGFWANIVKANMPQSRFLVQTQRYDFDELTRSSILPYFATDITIRFSNIPKNRVVIPVKDEECKIKYYAICLKQNSARFKELFH